MTASNKGLKTHLFQVEILVQGETNAKALEYLLHVLNNGGFPDFRVLSGSELGHIIEQLQQMNTSTPDNSTKSVTAAAQAAPANGSQNTKSTSTSASSSASKSPADPQLQRKIQTIRLHLSQRNSANI
ncbi:hypothetical protein PCURB6_11030 [Paenibacillus curdlanolyticus]|nr:hypothetical protein [Paenibacillus curdlanolyticus]GFN30843.1 hypothetical protein PCURB6_11030 [Paenibacillus curdlanolyticus]